MLACVKPGRRRLTGLGGVRSSRLTGRVARSAAALAELLEPNNDWSYWSFRGLTKVVSFVVSSAENCTNLRRGGRRGTN